MTRYKQFLKGKRYKNIFKPLEPFYISQEFYDIISLKYFMKMMDKYNIEIIKVANRFSDRCIIVYFECKDRLEWKKYLRYIKVFCK